MVVKRKIIQVEARQKRQRSRTEKVKGEAHGAVEEAKVPGVKALTV